MRLYDLSPSHPSFAEGYRYVVELADGTKCIGKTKSGATKHANRLIENRRKSWAELGSWKRQSDQQYFKTFAKHKNESED